MRWVLGVVACLGVGVLGAAAQEPKPKSNFIARVKVLSQSELAVTLEHSDKGRKNAFKYAGEHCARYGRIAVYQNGAKGWGPDTVSTWMCVKPEGSSPAEGAKAGSAPQN